VDGIDGALQQHLDQFVRVTALGARFDVDAVVAVGV
jgi:hypothetical protein